MSRSKQSPTARLWVLKFVVFNHISIHVIAKKLANFWNTMCKGVLNLGRNIFIVDVTKFDDVTTIRVDEHCCVPSWLRQMNDIVEPSNRPVRLLHFIPGLVAHRLSH